METKYWKKEADDNLRVFHLIKQKLTRMHEDIHSHRKLQQVDMIRYGNVFEAIENRTRTNISSLIGAQERGIGTTTNVVIRAAHDMIRFKKKNLIVVAATERYAKELSIRIMRAVLSALDLYNADIAHSAFRVTYKSNGIIFNTQSHNQTDMNRLRGIPLGTAVYAIDHWINPNLTLIQMEDLVDWVLEMETLNSLDPNLRPTRSF